ncbi:hypothetical protein [Paenibacillus cymbidii]|uniref:hypothetical protein n=1 Tax=Paenibacillus cymbidii TaxID=1639034 RepID=UPI001080906A|nr:hypothetical protein [Paenibacillus cymbidii]
MAVFVYKTGSIRVGALTSNIAIEVNTNNDDLGTNSQNILIWNTPNNATKTLLTSGAQAVAPNNAVLANFSISAITAFEVEVRYSNPNMVPRVVVTGDVTGSPLTFAPGTLFHASSETQNP